MKKLIILLLSVSIATLYLSCEKDNAVLPVNQEESIIEQIVATPNIEVVSVTDLPSSISNYVNLNHTTFEIESVFHAPPHGYEVFLENGLCLFFDQHGDHLNHDGMHGDFGNHHGGYGFGFSFCLAGDTLAIDVLPQAVLNYISDNYPGESVITVIVKPSGNLAIEISNGDIIMFDPEGDFIHLCDMQDSGGHGHSHGNMGNPGWHCDTAGHQGGMGGHHGNLPGMNEQCWGGTGLSIDSLPVAITEYVSDNYPDATIFHAMQTYSGNFFIRLSDCIRLVFDEDGNIIFDSGD